MAKNLARKALVGVAGLAAAAIGAGLVRRWRKMDRPAARLAVGASLAAWAVAGRWLLYPFLGAGKLSEPHEIRGNSSHKIKRPDGTELHVEVFGPSGAPTIILTHGLRHDGQQWYYLLRDLSSRFRLIVWDLPGVGQSKGPSNADYSLEKMAGDLEAVVDFAGGPAVLAGVSLGGMVVQSFCRLFPEHLGTRVTGLVLIDTTYTNPLRTTRWAPFWRAIQSPVLVPMWRAAIALAPLARAVDWLNFSNGSTHLMKRLMGFSGNQTWRQIDFSARLSSETPPAVNARMSLAALRFDEWNALPRIAVPVLVLAGEKDRVTPLDASREIEQRLPAARLVTVPGAGHYAVFEQHEAVSKAVADFVERCQHEPALPAAEGAEATAGP